MSTRFSVTIRCLNPDCGHRYKRVLMAENEDALSYVPDPPCPECRKRSKKKRFDYDGQAPAVGGSMVARAVDITAEIAMENTGLTDLRDDVREGETATPKLAPRLQQMADNMFARPKGRGHGANIMGLSPAAVRQAAVNGRFMTPDTPNPVAIQHTMKDRKPIEIVAGDGVGKRR
jgi:hypothetical protein